MMLRAAIVGWAVALVIELIASVWYSYRSSSEQPRYFKHVIRVIRIIVFALLAAVVYLLSVDDQVLTGVILVIVTVGSAFFALRFAYGRETRARAARMTNSDDPFEVQRFRRTAAWMIDLEVKDGRRPR
jgi:ABC-type uncharacterized transport system permease subunit